MRMIKFSMYKIIAKFIDFSVLQTINDYNIIEEFDMFLEYIEHIIAILSIFIDFFVFEGCMR